jgi:hypothetical protein
MVMTSYSFSNEDEGNKNTSTQLEKGSELVSDKSMLRKSTSMRRNNAERNSLVVQVKKLGDVKKDIAAGTPGLPPTIKITSNS